MRGVERTWVNISLGYHLFRNQELMLDNIPHFLYITHKYRTGSVKAEEQDSRLPSYCAGRPFPVYSHRASAARKFRHALPGN